ncbi:MAG: DUF547 domain-containing protein [Methylococcales bacterium]
MPIETVPSRSDPIRAWAEVLNKFVDDSGRIDFQGLKHDRTALDEYVAYVASTGFDAFPRRDDLIAHHINAYNALAMWAVLEKGIQLTHAGLNKVLFFYNTKMKIGKTDLSLYAYENDFIRPLGEERVHFALNCMAVSCPRLPKKPFSGKDLQQELDRETRLFLAEPRNLRIDRENKTVWLSEILDFYPEDFLKKAPSVTAYVARYDKRLIPGTYEVRFIPYDWRINDSSRIR